MSPEAWVLSAVITVASAPTASLVATVEKTDTSPLVVKGVRRAWACVTVRSVALAVAPVLLPLIVSVGA